MTRLITGFSLGLWLSSAIAIGQWLDPEHLPWLWPRLDGNAGLWANQNTFAEATAIAIVACTAYRMWWLIPGLIPGLALTESRAAKLAVVIGLLAILWNSLRTKWWRWIAFAIVGVAGLGSAAILYLTGYKTGSNVERWNIFLDVIDGLNWIGHGLGSFKTAFPFYATHTDTFTWKIEYAHNDFLQVLFEIGPIGLSLCVGFLATCCMGHTRDRPVCLAFVVLCACGFASHMPATAFMGAVFLGAAAGGEDERS